VISRFWQSPAIFRKVDILNGGVIAAVLAGAHIANPRRYPFYSRKNIQDAYDLVAYSLLLNDKKDLQKFVSTAQDGEIKDDFQKLCDKCNFLEADLLKRSNPVIRSFIDEINAFEDWVQSKPQSFWDFKHTKTAREVMNVINTACTYALLVGLPHIGVQITQHELRKAPLEALCRKYAFALDQRPDSPDENAITILWSLAMLTQTYDDETDRVVDSMCRLNTFATVLYRQHLTHISAQVVANKKHQTIDELVTRKVGKDLYKLREQYSDIAKKHGYHPVKLHDNFFNSILLFLKSFVLLHTRLPLSLRKRLAANITSLREKWIIKGKFTQL